LTGDPDAAGGAQNDAGVVHFSRRAKKRDIKRRDGASGTINLTAAGDEEGAGIAIQSQGYRMRNRGRNGAADHDIPIADYLLIQYFSKKEN
jgi:hypothetical protein